MTNEERLLNKLDRLDEHLGKIDVTLAKQHVSLQEHLRRTELAEENVESLRTELTPIKRHVAFVEASLRAVASLAAGVGLILGAAKIWLEIKK